ncbi:hypothetical protein MPNT_20076 [Candidatus Methylacidithermus pantelleriae]|uniref:Uncharacterized protein n=1 Tax=Candidatus Methylacidithermus pantelleriae TaxID=2744239 RepID=A0A8J2BLB4_9BACT|nr:hypothetical protein MPNT_20076 [Candidatus Methylacidithermus pantelleriae]
MEFETPKISPNLCARQPPPSLCLGDGLAGCYRYATTQAAIEHHLAQFRPSGSTEIPALFPIGRMRFARQSPTDFFLERPRQMRPLASERGR